MITMYIAAGITAGYWHTAPCLTSGIGSTTGFGSGSGTGSGSSSSSELDEET